MPDLSRLVAIAALLLTATRAVESQELHGSVVDSATRRPIASAVLVLVDDASIPRARTITHDRGEFRIQLPGDVHTVRALRLGFRARELPLVPGVTELNIAMVAIPTLLEKVTVQAARACPRRDDAQSALALLEQARAGFLATIVAAEANPATMKLLHFERWMDGTSDRIDRQKVRIDSVTGRMKSFEASNSAADFVRDGFARDSAGSRIFYGPDAEVLLDDSFANGYCFRLMDHDRGRPNQVGLGFAAAGRQKDRVDLDGAVWIDTAARRLVDIDFRYDGLQLPRNAPTLGGHVWFHEMPNGMVVIQSWVLLLAGATVDTVEYALRSAVRQRFYGHEVGGEVARAIWSDGRAWKAPLGTVQLHVVTGEGIPTNRVAVRLGESDYLASPDVNGNLEIPDVLPGPYDVFVIDTSVAAAGTLLGTPLRFDARRDSTIRAVLVTPPPEAFLFRRCASIPAFEWITANVMHEDGTPFKDARWEAGEDFNTSWEYVYARGRTGAAGTFSFCSELTKGGGLQLRVSDGLEPRDEVVVSLTARSERVKVTLRTRAPSASSPR